MSEATTFEGRTSAMRTSPWLASEDLDGLGEVPVTIESVFQHKDAIMQDGRKQPKLFAVKFEGKDRQLVLNATNRKTLAAAFGSEILLYVKDGVRNPAGGTTKGIRIK
jgi:hypothetical protein